ncbi:MAG TPA: hypothetical protein VFF31_30725 [Blastocatellia bacterium]|nr:hypothetical protein [Blastocatellia bacterium]
MADDATNFVFRVEGLKLSAQDQQRISQAIAGAVGAELVKLHKPVDPPMIVKPFPWPGGIWIRALKDVGVFDRVKRLGAEKVNVQIGGQ